MDRDINLYSIALTQRNELLARGLSRVLSSVVRLFVGMYRSYRKQKEEADAIAHLEAMDDRLLRDIGIEHHQIRDVVKGQMAEPNCLPPDGTPSRSGGEAPHTILQAIRKWNQGRTTAQQLRRIERPLSSDIGSERGDIHRIAPGPAPRSLRQGSADNDNRARTAA